MASPSDSWSDSNPGADVVERWDVPGQPDPQKERALSHDEAGKGHVQAEPPANAANAADTVDRPDDGSPGRRWQAVMVGATAPTMTVPASSDGAA